MPVVARDANKYQYLPREKVIIVLSNLDLNCKLTKPEKLTSGSQFAAVQKFGKKIYARSFVIYYHFVNSGVSKVGLTVSKKVDKRAVVRNRVKRFAREIFRHSKNDFKRPTEMVLIARTQAATAKLSDLKNDLIKAFKSAEIIK